MTKCNTCKKEFEIRDEDLVFYEQIKTAPPLDCPDCRMARRLVFRNERTLYKRKCDLCEKDIVALYPNNSSFTVYCHNCWWSDSWDPKNYAMDYNLNKAFSEQFKELMTKVPRISLMVVNNVRSEYTNGSAENKDCYLVFAADYNEDCSYGRLLQRNKFCIDCAFVHESELCYECIDTRTCFKCMFSEQCQSSSNLLFCYDMRNSQNCILCTNGRNMSNSILNIKYSKEEFEKKKAKIIESYETIEKAKEKLEKLKEKAITKFAPQTKCRNVTGNYLYNCYDGIMLYDTYDARNCSYMKDTENPTDSWDCNNYYYKCEFSYNVIGAMQISKVKNSAFIFYSNESEFCENSYHLTNCFGCIGIRKGEYMILNKQYTKEEYHKLKKKIDERMKKEKSFGQFFPPKIAPYGYNESLAQDYFPLSKEEAIKRGFKWQEQTTGIFGKETIKDIPKEIDDSLLAEIFICSDCGKNYKLIKTELEFYNRMNLPIPRKDFECRHQDRMNKRNPRKLFKRECMCQEKKHHNHKDNHCKEKFETSYSTDRKETIYCESCYQQEVA